MVYINFNGAKVIHISQGACPNFLVFPASFFKNSWCFINVKY